MNGPWPAGEQDDRTKFCGGTKEVEEKKRDQSALYFKLKPGQKAVGGKIYEGIPHKVTVKRRGHSKQVKDFIKRALARQENYHGRLWEYQVLRKDFRHNKDKMSKHKMCTEAVNVIVQYDIKYHPLLEV